jgi:DNA repair protein RecO (recombination protein O)
MSRTFVYSALVLRSRPSGESNNEISLLTAEEGIVKATVFGGAKSKLRSHSAPYNSGQVWIYRDPAKDYGKLSDFDVHSWRPGLRELYDRTMAAGGVAETILATHGGGGDWGKALELAEAALDALESANEELCPRILVHFLWLWAGFLGIRPEIEHCSSCGIEAANSPLWFSSRENTLLCGNCAQSESSVPKAKLCPQSQALSPKPSSVPQSQALSPKSSSVPISGLLQLNPGCLRWLTAAGSVEPSLLYRYSMDNKSFNETKALTAAVITAALGKRLASWDW